MNVQIRCDVCGHTCWAKGYSEPDVGINAAVSEDDPIEDGCEHIKDGGDFTIIDWEYEEYDD